MTPALAPLLRSVMSDPARYTRAAKVTLRPYQADIARAIADSVRGGKGLTFVTAISRQGGKNEAEAAIEAYLLALLQYTPAEMVVVSPTFKPQTENAMRRLERALNANPLTRGRWAKESGYIYRLGEARALFFSGHQESNVVGATAKTLLLCDEAQDVTTAKWDKDFAPMAASTNATTAFFGTIWTDQTLLARELRAALRAQEQDGARRVWMVNADEVAAHVSPYGQYVRGQVAKLGRQHPLIKSQYYLEEINAEGGLFPPARRALMTGAHPRQFAPSDGETYAVTIDIGGEDEDHPAAAIAHTRQREPKRDSTAVTIARLNFDSLELLGKPTFEVIERHQWTGAKQINQLGRLRAIIELWHPLTAIIDATGVGAGLAGLLASAYPNIVQPFIFTPQSKSALGWAFLGIIDSGRWRDHARGHTPDPLQEHFFEQVAACQYEVLPGPGQLMRWAVPDSQRRPLAEGELLHDDLLISAALMAMLDSQTWAAPSTSAPQTWTPDPLKEKGEY